MKQRRWLTILRWLCVLPAVGLTFFACVFIASLINPYIINELLDSRLIGPERGNGAPRWELLWDGPIAAISFVLVGAFAAPSSRRAIALVLFGLGAFLTPRLVDEFNMVAYNPVPLDLERLSIVCMHWTIAVTYTAGILAVVVVFIVTRRSSTPWSA